MTGILISTNDQEKLCVPEAYNLLNEVFSMLLHSYESDCIYVHGLIQQSVTHIVRIFIICLVDKCIYIYYTPVSMIFVNYIVFIPLYTFECNSFRIPFVLVC